MAPQQIPWAGMPETHRKADGTLKAIYLYKVGERGIVKPPLTAWKKGWLGAFWGCQDFDEGVPCDLVVCDTWTDERGQNFFRPMWDCRMRHLGLFDEFFGPLTFCRVCDGELELKIQGYVSSAVLAQLPRLPFTRVPRPRGVPFL
jgi:hypothetical protein